MEGLLPYFRKQEGNQRLDNEAHGADGPLKVSDPLYKADVADRFVRAMQRKGLPFATDFNAGTLRGVGYVQTTYAQGATLQCCRCVPCAGQVRSAAVPGHTSQCASHCFRGRRRAVGVGLHGRRRARAGAGVVEVIVCAGAFATPKLLMLSGIGPAAHLREHGVEVRVDSPGVGENLQDHNVAVVSMTTHGQHGYFGEDRGARALWNGLQYLAFHNGPIASNGAETMAFVNLSVPDGEPDPAALLRWGYVARSAGSKAVLRHDADGESRAAAFTRNRAAEIGRPGQTMHWSIPTGSTMTKTRSGSSKRSGI